MSLSAGTIIANRFQIVKCLGAGSMGEVYLGLDLEFESQPAALKFLQPKKGSDAMTMIRFCNEVVYMRQMQHKNIVKVSGFGLTDDGRCYISMEYVDGGSLENILHNPKSKLSLEQSVNILLQISEGMDCAHRQGIIHRDLKPHNILMTKSGQVKIADFGMAKLLSLDHCATNTGETVGTPAYMSPEQIMAKQLDHRSDIYSIGIIAFRMLAGRLPFIEDSSYELATAHLEQTLPTHYLKEAGVPGWLQKMIIKSTSKKKEKRFQSALEMVGILRKHTGSKRRCSWNRIAFASSSDSTLRRMRHIISPKPDPRMHRNARIAAPLIVFLLLLIGLPICGLNMHWNKQVKSENAESEVLPSEKQSSSDSTVPLDKPKLQILYTINYRNENAPKAKYLQSISVWLRNSGDVAAKYVVVILMMPDGQMMSFPGPKEVGPLTSTKFILPIDRPLKSQDGIKIGVSCINCDTT